VLCENGVRSIIRGRGRIAVLCLLFFLSVVASGCGAVKGPSGEDYFKVLDRWSRGQKVYQGLETRLYINATYKTSEFRQAYIERYSTSYELGPDQAKALMERETEQAEAFNEFFFTAYTPDVALNDFDLKESVWLLYIEDSAGNRAKPISVTAVDGSEPVIREFFPYFDLWSKAYTVKFPKYAESGGEINPEKGPVKLIVTGVMGKGELEWRSGT
jgi:hypothetical protein